MAAANPIITAKNEKTATISPRLTPLKQAMAKRISSIMSITIGAQFRLKVKGVWLREEKPIKLFVQKSISPFVQNAFHYFILYRQDDQPATAV
jgi:hypothetical protein